MKSLRLLSAWLVLMITAPIALASDAKDPWEGFNRAVFAFNDAADTYVIRPVAVGYQKVTPGPLRRGVSNVFANLLEVPNAFNDILQGKFGEAGKDTGRFVINSTLGVVGLFDVASHMGLERSDGEDFGQTLASWGVPDGPYLVLPVLGPRTLRDAAGMPVDWVTDPKTYIGHARTSYEVKALDLLDQREGLLSLEQNIGSDKYTLYRDIYLQRREFLINDGEVEDDFGGDLDDFDDF
ncbi:VacJ family lipoprotein [Gilvimarinus sp. SDUM040013]|uniref:VacJ family lipoprotein n=1 Tax=Gilvimarinus gilvus TaxID=3058038 RepID=A0ABU4RTD0_9GAMM|nr:VacJ family lipoprotein [Gilvimarinus sp. SDUM040013]MDO3386961.1 VacJ family lipoprotein [Gilvimarinus sp. SDUM040013]MDX6848145.1 VacJ family lipoprotein [Gilvimarinus sp. SDUM040013]